MELNHLIHNYQSELIELRKKLDEKRFSLGEADSAKESRFPTGRIELESEIKMLEDKIVSTQTLLGRLLEIAKSQRTSDRVVNGTWVRLKIGDEIDDYFVIEGDGDLTNNILSIGSPIGTAIFNLKKGDETDLPSGLRLEILEIN